VKARRSNAHLAQQADRPLSGRVRGVINIAQKDRFRLEDTQDHGCFLIVGRRAGPSLGDLRCWSEGRAPVAVQYEGPPDRGAVTVHVQVQAARAEGDPR
jgi:hypothetical protein